MRLSPIAAALQLALIALAAPAIAQQTAGAAPSPQDEELERVVVTGSRIPRAQVEGPAPVTAITAEQIQAQGFVNVADVLRSLTQNTGQTQSEQSSSGADFSPGSQQVDLRGLGPNHTLVLVNGRRIADFPLPFKGRSNFTDISSIPLGMVDRVEVLTGSASAIYGSDAISGVVNIILKQRVDGTTVSYRYGDSERGGGQSHRLNLSTGFSSGDFNLVFGLDAVDRKPLWAYQREIQNSTLDAPTARSQVARRVFLRTDWWDDYIDPGAATCASLSHLNQGTTGYFNRPGYGRFCGSTESIGYGTITSSRKALNAYAAASYPISDTLEWFGDLQLGRQKVEQFRDVRSWAHMAADGNEEGYFYNQATGQVEYWARQFTPEEMGGLGKGMVRNEQNTMALTTGFKGTFAQDWDWEAAYSWSQYKSKVSWPQIVSAAANRLFLGEELGEHTDRRGNVFPIYNANPARLYTPLTRAEYDSIAAYTTYRPRTSSQTASLTLTNTGLFSLPGGDAGFAAVAELGRQTYAINPDPRALEYYYYSWKDSDGSGSRNRWATAGELSLPLLAKLEMSVAARYDHYSFAGRNLGKSTWSAGLQWRPWESLLVRGSYGTGFRAPDMHYVFAGEGNVEGSAIDYYRCRTEQPDEEIGDCDFSSERVIVGRRGSRDLDPETSTSWTAGFVYSPSANFDLSIDYFGIAMRNVVEDQRLSLLLRTEADCRIGRTANGQPVDPTSPSCIAAVAAIQRLGDGRLYGGQIHPVNVAREDTTGIDAATSWRIPTAIGDFRFSAGYTWVRSHTVQRYPGDPVENQLLPESGWYIPRNKANASIGYSRDRFGATVYASRLSRLPNYAENAWNPATWRYNLSMHYGFTDHSQLSLSVVNLLDKMPPRDPTWTGYPYYDMNWFDPTGRALYLQYTHKFGGAPL